MQRLASVASVLTVLAIAPAFAQDKTPTIKEIMTQLHRGPNCLRARISKALKADELDWDALHKDTKAFARLAENLGKNEAPRGAKDSWDKLSEEFSKQAKALNDAAEKKSKADAQAAHAKLGNCATCHKAHKP
jgi:cytochrome c553